MYETALIDQIVEDLESLGFGQSKGQNKRKGKQNWKDQSKDNGVKANKYAPGAEQVIQVRRRIITNLILDVS